MRAWARASILKCDGRVDEKILTDEGDHSDAGRCFFDADERSGDSCSGMVDPKTCTYFPEFSVILADGSDY